MIGQEDIERMRARGELVITTQTFRKSVVSSGLFRNLQLGDGKGSKDLVRYRGRLWSHEWILTYSMQQYERLIPIPESEIDIEDSPAHAYGNDPVQCPDPSCPTHNGEDA